MRIIISITSIALIILFASLGSVWIGFQYFSLSALSLLCLFWVVLLVQDYIYEYVTKYEEKFNIYFVKMINMENVNSEIAKKNKLIYQKKFNKTLIKEKSIEWIKILVLYAIIGLCIIAMIRFIGNWNIIFIKLKIVAKNIFLWYYL